MRGNLLTAALTLTLDRGSIHPQCTRTQAYFHHEKILRSCHSCLNIPKYEDYPNSQYIKGFWGD